MNRGYQYLTRERPNPKVKTPAVATRDPGNPIHKRIPGSNIPPFHRSSHKINSQLSGAPTIVPRIASINADIMKSPTEEELNEYVWVQHKIGKQQSV
jgi:hypothetical protein